MLADGLAGVAIYPRNYRSPADLRALTDQIRRAARDPVLIGIDQEGGTRFALDEPFTRWPSPPELARIGDATLVETTAYSIALELRAAGVNVDFAPMLDLAINPDSPVTMDRSFGGNPAEVARFGVAFVRGLTAGGVLGCAKHFPGHGDAAIDPHRDLPSFQGSLDRLSQRELVPFAAVIEQRVSLIMTAHILLPRIDPTVPASLSKRIVRDLLRTEMHYTGVIIADDLGMGAISRAYGTGESAIKAFEAGTDVNMLCHNWSAVPLGIEAAQRAFDAGTLDAAAHETARQRIARLREQIESGPSETPPIEVIGCASHRALAAEIRSRLAALPNNRLVPRNAN